AAHLGIPASRLVTEVDSGLQELAHRDDGHRDEVPFPGWCSLLPLGSSGTDVRRTSAPPPELSSGSGYEAAAILAAICRSSGSGHPTSTRSRVNGCGNASRAAWRNCRLSPSSCGRP